MRGNIHGGKLGSKRVCLGVQISSEMHQSLILVAKENHLTMSDIVRLAISNYVKTTKQVS